MPFLNGFCRADVLLLQAGTLVALLTQSLTVLSACLRHDI